MDALEIEDERSLRAWLSDKPTDWAQTIALRAALRALPYISDASDEWLAKFALLPFGALITSWTQLIYPSYFKRSDASRANARFGGDKFDFELFKSEEIPLRAANASYHSADAQSGSFHTISDCIFGVREAALAIQAADERGIISTLENLDAHSSFWIAVRHDADYLTRLSGDKSVATVATYSLWDHAPVEWKIECIRLEQRLLAIDHNFSNWIDWFNRRVEGYHAAFDIPGDADGKENETILIRLADATNEDFWDNGPEFVNTTLKGWIDEAVARLATSLPQDPNATAYAVNTQGKVDRLPASEQQQLRDTTSQREKYADLREAVEDLASRGQRLGERLNRAIPRIAQSLPNNFDDAEAYPLWRDANQLRRIYRAHRIAEKSDEFDDAKLDPVVAEDLGGMLDLYSLFSLGDDSLRAMDEATIPPQERDEDEAQARFGAPVVKALLKEPRLSTPIAFNDLTSIASDSDLPNDDPYASQVLAQNNKTISNYIAAVLSGAFRVIKTRPGKVGAAMAIGGAGALGNVGVREILGHSGAIVEFVIQQAPILKAYAATVFASHPVPALIDDLIARFGAFFR